MAKITWTLVLGLLILLSLPTHAQSLAYSDNWSSNNGSSSDGVSWGGYSLGATATNIPTNSDCLCWDWNDNASDDNLIANWENCYCKTGTAQTQCMAISTLVTSVCNAGNCAVQSLSANHPINTGSSGQAWSNSLDIREYRDCDNSSGQQGAYNWLDQDGNPYFVVYPKQYDCDNQSSTVYDFEGTFASGSNVNIAIDISCPAYKACDESDAHTNHDDVLITNPTASIPSPCSTVDGLQNENECSSWAACLSGVCSGARTYHTNFCFADQSVGFSNLQVPFTNTCGGSGHQEDDSGGSYQCNLQLGSGYVCDADLDALQYLNDMNAPAFCKKNVYTSCSTNSNCWNDNGGIDCMGSSGNKVCTYGNNGDSCFNNDNAQCDSNRCDGTCQARLADGNSCDEASDCTANACTTGFCGTGSGSGSSCTLDTDCASQLCVANVCQSTVNYNPSISRTDSWADANSAGNSTTDDGAVFVNGAVYPKTAGLREQTDMLCYDLDGNGTYDACYYDTNGCGGSGCSANSCNYFSIPNGISNKYSCDIDSPNGCRVGLDGGTAPKICTGSGCLVSTAQGADFRQIQAKAYTDCDDSSSLRAETSVTSDSSNASYFVAHAKYYEAVSNIPNEWEYYITGQFGSSDLNSYEINSISCPANYAVDRVAEELRVYTPNGTIPSVCKKIPEQSCTSNSQCLYNVCSGNVCQLSGGIKGHLYDESFQPLANKVMKLYTCSNALVSTSTTDTYGKYGFYMSPGSYKLKTTAPWGDVTFVWQGEPSGCHYYGSGFNLMWATLSMHAHIEGRALNPQGFPSVGLNFDASTCSNTVMDTDTTDSQGEFDLVSDSGYQKLNVDLNGNKYPITDANNNACIFRAGNVDVGDLTVTANCSLYNDTCSDANPNVRLFSCSQSSANGCSCLSQVCVAGCTSGAPQCNAVGTGTLKVTVQDVNGEGIPYVNVRVDTVSQGITNYLGKKEVNTLHGMHLVNVTCPTGSPSGQQSAYLNGNQKFVNFTLNCPAQPKGDLVIQAKSGSGYPVANVIIEINGQEKGQTNPFGFVRIEDVAYGSKTITAHYGLLNDLNQVIPYNRSTQTDVNSPLATVNFSILAPGQLGFSSVSEPNYHPTFVPVLLAAADVISFEMDVQDYCNCMYGDSGSILVNSCVSQITSPQCTNANACIDGLVSFLGQTANQCPLEGAFLIGDTALPLIPLGFLKHTAVHFLGFGLAHLDDLQNGGNVIKKVGESVEYTKQGAKKVGEKADDVPSILKKAPNVGISLQGLTQAEINVIENLIQRAGPGGEDAFKGLIGQSDNYFAITSDYMKMSYKNLAKLKTKLPAADYIKLEQRLADSRSNFNNAKGALGEIEAGASQEFENRLLKYDDYPSGSSKKFDFEVDDGFVEIKTTDMINGTQTESTINELVQKAVEWHDIYPNKKFYARFKHPINSEISDRIANDILERRPNYGLSMLSVSSFN